jgi:hypothetical protein
MITVVSAHMLKTPPLSQELHEKKKHMANIIELSNLAYESRDSYQMEIAAVDQVVYFAPFAFHHDHPRRGVVTVL